MNNNNTIYPTDECWSECIAYCRDNDIADYVTYCSAYCTLPLYFNEVFYDATDFVDKVESVGTDTTNLADLYYLLANKYAWSRTRYMDALPFILALKRELQISWPAYLKRKDLMDDIYQLQLTDLRIQMENISSNLQNTVNANNSPVVNADTVAISNKSNSQTSVNNDVQILSGKIEAIIKQYELVNIDYLQEIYRKVDPLFRVIL